MLFTVQIKGCMVSDDILWVQITSTNWEIEAPEIEYNELDDHTIFTFTGNGTFNNPHEEDFRVVHSDGCGWKSSIAYSPNATIQNPLEGINYYPMACDLAIMPIDYPSGKTNFVIFGGIMFPSELETLPLGFYDISIAFPGSENKNVTNINYLISAEGETVVLRQGKFCGSPPSEVSETSTETSVESSQESLNVDLEFYLLPVLAGILTIAYPYRKCMISKK
jgi:hypothetical protein